MFAGVRRAAIEFAPLGSLTNSTYKVTVGGESYALRLPGKDTADYIDRAAEEHNARAATAAGVNAGILYLDASSGMMLSEFVEGTAMNSDEFVRGPYMPVRAALTLRRIHRLGPVFRTRFDVFAILGNYRRILRASGASVAGDRAARRGAKAVRRALEASPAVLAPCHNDPWPGNFVDAGERLYLIDWEFSGMNDPMWDLADLSVEAGFDPEQDRTMMEAHHAGPVPPALYSRLELYKAMTDLLWSYWGFLQVANDNPRDDFQSYARRRFEQCEARMSDPDFQEHLDAVRGKKRRAFYEPAPTPVTESPVPGETDRTLTGGRVAKVPPPRVQ